jgi:hypothetical protein
MVYVEECYLVWDHLFATSLQDKYNQTTQKTSAGAYIYK